MSKQKQETESILPAKQAIQNTELCQHCSVYPAATPPFTERVYLKGTALTQRILEKIIKGTDIPPECAACFCIREFFKLPDDEKLKRLKADFEQQKAKRN